MWNSGSVDEATWAALAASLTVLGLIWTWVAYRRRGGVAATRALGFTLLPAAAWLTGTLEMFTEIAGSVTDWATSLVFNPVTWTGVGLAGFGVVLIFISGVLRDRQIARGQAVGSGATKPLPPTSTSKGAKSEPILEGGLDDDIEAILKRRGIQ